jgi:rod shape determining protein RodA
MIGSATGLGDGISHPIFINQIIFVISGIIIMLVFAFINFDIISKFYIPMYIINIFLLIIVFFINPENAAVARWIGIEFFGIQFGIQPSEFAKLIMIIVLAKLIDKYRENINNILILLVFFAISIIPFILIYLQPSYSASMVILFIMIAMLYIGGISYKYIFIPTIILAPILLFLFIDLHAENPIFITEIFADWQIERIWYFLYPDQDFSDRTFQNRQAISAMSSGLLTGQGLFNNQIIIPESSNDFIFALTASEFGFLGSIAILSIVFIIIIRIFIIANRSYSNIGRLIASGIGSIIAFQSLIHIAVNIRLLPNTGMNFPFLSSGGSSMWVFMAGIGIILNIGMMRRISIFEDLIEKGK